MIEYNQLRDRVKDRKLTKRQVAKTKKKQRKGIERKHQQPHYMAKTHSCLISSSVTQQGQDTGTKKIF